VKRKEPLKNTRKIIKKRSDNPDQTKAFKRRVWNLQQTQLILMRRKKLLAELKEELGDITQENLEQILTALELS